MTWILALVTVLVLWSMAVACYREAARRRPSPLPPGRSWPRRASAGCGVGREVLAEASTTRVLSRRSGPTDAHLSACSHDLEHVRGEVGQAGMGVEPAGRGHDVGLRPAERFGLPARHGRLVDGGPVAGKADEQHGGGAEPFGQVAHPGRHRPGTPRASSSSARRVARLARSVIPTPSTLRARSGWRATVTSPAAMAAGQKRLVPPA